MTNILFFGAIGLIALFGLIFISYFNLWFRAFVSGAPISLFSLVGMSLRKVPSKHIVDAKICLTKAGIKEISFNDLETHYLAGGGITQLVRAYIAAQKARISLDWRQATAIDLAGRDLFDAVKTSVNPKVINCPSEAETISAVAGNGIELLVRARVTVRTNIAQLIGGATEETVIARVGEGIVNAIGSADSHFDVLKAPQSISEAVLEKGLDDQTAFEILSIDIADITVGSNIGASLQTDQAAADMKVARAKAESRKSQAIALEHEYKAKIKENEAKIPLAIARAFENGNLGIMDYYKMGNIQADTKMRDALSQEGHVAQPEAN
ncbi:MAG: hypothetical protein S4CHLAM102_03540 [Chlamydiia bacterium]|nr:hypothetical protein [Chlamydiia bacterium]